MLHILGLEVSFGWCIFAAFILLLLFTTYSLNRYYVDPSEAYPLATVSIVLSLSVSFLCVLLIPIDIFITGLSSSSIPSSDAFGLPVELTHQDSIRSAYTLLFSALLVLTFVIVPYVYFYGEERGCASDLGEDDRCGPLCTAFSRTVVFWVVLCGLFMCGLIAQPGPTLKKGQELEWVRDVLDVDHSGAAAMAFSIASLTSFGVILWLSYSAYGMADLPFDWIRGRRPAHEERREVQTDIASLREKHRSIQAKYAREGDLSDTSRMTPKDRRQVAKLQKDQRALTHHNYRLQELEQLSSGNLISTILRLLTPFRMLVGVVMLVVCLLVVLSTFVSFIDRFVNSKCGFACGYTIQEFHFRNPLDEFFVSLSQYFPMDLVFVLSIAVFIFLASLFGITSLGIRAVCFPIYRIKPRKTPPQALLILCFLTTHILLVLGMTLLTIAPNYTTYGSQIYKSPDGITRACSPSDPSCRRTVIASLFAKITIGVWPIFSQIYFMSNGVFLVCFTCFFIYSAFIKKPRGHLDELEDIELEADEEGVGLLSMAS